MASQQTRREFLQDEPIQVHNIVTREELKSLVQQGVVGLLEKVEIKAEASSSYDLGTIDRALETLRGRREKIANTFPFVPPPEMLKIEEEIKYLIDLRARTK